DSNAAKTRARRGLSSEVHELDTAFAHSDRPARLSRHDDRIHIFNRQDDSPSSRTVNSGRRRGFRSRRVGKSTSTSLLQQVHRPKRPPKKPKKPKKPLRPVKTPAAIRKERFLRQVRYWIDGHPAIANAITWQDSSNGGLRSF